MARLYRGELPNVELGCRGSFATSGRQPAAPYGRQPTGRGATAELRPRASPQTVTYARRALMAAPRGRAVLVACRASSRRERSQSRALPGGRVACGNGAARHP
jgi:hypothetical protein